MVAVLDGLGSAPAAILHVCQLILMHTKVRGRQFFWLRFCLPWARILAAVFIPVSHALDISVFHAFLR